jgi:ferrous iron transport protein B
MDLVQNFHRTETPTPITVLPEAGERASIVLVGLDNSGKSSLFREWAGHSTGTLLPFKNAGVLCRRALCRGLSCELIEAPDIRLIGDHAATLNVLHQLDEEDTVLLVVRGTDADLDAARLMDLVREELSGRRVAMVVTYKDKCAYATEKFAKRCSEELGIPVTSINARKFNRYDQQEMADLVGKAHVLERTDIHGWEDAEAALEPVATLLEVPAIGKAVALTCLFAFFAITVTLTYLFARWAEGPFMQSLSAFLGRMLERMPDGPFLFLFGAHGEGPLLLMIGLLLWVLPLVIFYALGHAIVSESGIKDRVTSVLDPIAREIGIAGRELLPVICGYGNKVIGVLESRSSSSSTRKPTVSFIALGTASFYQVAAAGMLFTMLGHYWLMAPYLLLLFLVGVLHSRIWYGTLPPEQLVPVSNPSFIQIPRPSAILWHVRASVKEFVTHALPLFALSFLLIGICVHFGAFEALAQMLAPVMGLFRLPAEAAPALIWSLARKDIMIAMLSTDTGGIMHALSVGQIFVLVYFASVFSATLPTLFIIWRELGKKFALKMMGTQLLTAVVTTLVLAYTIIPWY